MAIDVKQFYEEYLKPLSKEDQRLLLAFTAEEMARTETASSEEPQSELDPLTEAAWRIYNGNLKAMLEPDYRGQVVAIDIDSEDYEVAKRTSLAWRPLKARRPDARIVLVDIGVVGTGDSLELRRKGLLSSRSKSS